MTKNDSAPVFILGSVFFSVAHGFKYGLVEGFWAFGISLMALAIVGFVTAPMRHING